MDVSQTVSVPVHSAVRIEDAGKVLWFDPYNLSEDYNDADIVFITHSHYDHFSPEDIERVWQPGAIMVVPETMMADEEFRATYIADAYPLKPGEDAYVKGVSIAAVAAYNIDKEFHPESNAWLGYVVRLGDATYYVAGDTDNTPEAQKVAADVVVVPIGGTYTMTAEEAAELVAVIGPKVAVPTHYGSVVGDAGLGEVFAQAVAAAAPNVETRLLLGK